MASLSSQTSANPAADSTESPASPLDALSEQDSRWIDCYTSSICDFDPVRLSKETNQSMSQVLEWLNQPHIHATLELFDKVAQEGFNRRATAARMTALNSLDYLQDRVTDLVELRRVLALVARFIQPPRATRPTPGAPPPNRPPPPRPPSNVSTQPQTRRAKPSASTPTPLPAGELASSASKPEPAAASSNQQAPRSSNSTIRVSGLDSRRGTATEQRTPDTSESSRSPITHTSQRRAPTYFESG